MLNEQCKYSSRYLKTKSHLLQLFNLNSTKCYALVHNINIRFINNRSFNNVIKSYVLQFTCVNTNDTMHKFFSINNDMRKILITYRSGDICRSV